MTIENPKTGSLPRVAQRVSIAQRIKQLESAKNPSAEAPVGVNVPDPILETNISAEYTLTSTMLHASLFGTDFYAEPVLTVTQAGELQATDVVAAVDLFQVRWEDAVYLPAEKAQGAHLLLLGDDVDPRELEALAVSIWATAHWAGPGQLFLFEGASLKGPFKFTANDTATLEVPAELPQAWILDVTPERVPDTGVFIGVQDTWSQVFSGEHPAGNELGALNAVRRIAKRLAGAIRVAGQVKLVQPDPESAVNLRVYSNRWLDSADLTYLLEGLFPDIVPSGNATDTVEAQLTQNREELALARDITANLYERVAEVSSSAVQKAYAGTTMPESYSLLASAGNRSRVHVTVQVTDFLPMAIRHQPWPDGKAVEYGIQWIPAGHTSYGFNVSDFNVPLTRTMRLERSRVRDEIEKIAYLISKATAGQILDEDGFLVAS
ncbi:hypothetical protein HMPREF0044_0301 [Gleimia coleocanis DSM 15436]|uniref:Uncharacterized protein n=1 Tax=Gleimia coleocanis DSM 15436 TaxID=525245 RepID=C0VYR1_9ACTO|nr:hypothetical protein [Gleimia coleocanis]EEH64564.1 hypothetical protein HMPREF0044_0301 [Gleimia coleocanis DSM 15436]